MVYRIHFTVEDLARTRVAQAPHPLLELSAAVRTLRPHSPPLRLQAWRRHALGELAGLDSAARTVLNLVPARGWSPDFLVPTGGGSIQELLDRVRFTSRSQIRADLAHMAQWQPIPLWARNLPHDTELLQRVYDSLDQVCAVVLAPFWTQITNATAADRGVRMRQVLAGGMEGILASLDPRRIRWSPPVLEVAMISGRDDDLHLAGRGLLLVPSVFGAETPAIDAGAAPQPVMSFPVRSDHLAKTQPLPLPPTQSGPPTTEAALAALLGHTRAAVLTAIAEHPGCSTKELATHTGITSPSASEHATVLRTAGLIATIRHRNTALHSPTPLGAALLNTSPGRPLGPDGTTPSTRG